MYYLNYKTDFWIYLTHVLYIAIFPLLYDSGWPVGDHDWLERFVSLIWLIVTNINKVVWAVNENFFVELYKITGLVTLNVSRYIWYCFVTSCSERDTWLLPA